MGMNNSWLAGLNGLLNGGVEGFKTGKTLQDMAAERALKKNEFQLKVAQARNGQTVIAPDGTKYQSEGISDELASGLLGSPVTPRAILPGAVNVGGGKISVVKSNTAPIIPINVPEATYNENPSLYQEAPAGHKYNIIKTSKGPVDPAVADAKDGLQQLRKLYLSNGNLTDAQAKLAKGYAKTIGANVTTEEDTGLMSWYSRNIGDGSNQLVPGKTSQTPASSTSKVQEIKRKTADGKTAIFDANTKKFIRYE